MPGHCTLSGPQAVTGIWAKAFAAVHLYERGRRNYSRIKPHNHLVIRISLRWRLLSKNGGSHWRLMTHETYNKESRK